MYTKIQKWGNSQGLCLAKNVLKDARLEVGSEVNVTVRDGIITIMPIRKIRKRYCLDDLVAQIPKDYYTSEVNWGKPVGKEVW